jgi:NAD-specific glutamate dehydrogenase
VEDFHAMASPTETACRLHTRAGTEVESRAFIRWLLIELRRLWRCPLYCRADGRATDQDSVTGVFNDPELLPVVFPGLMEEVESHILPSPNDLRIVSLDYSKNASAIYHLDPIDTIVLREWDARGNLAGASLLLGRFARGTFVQRADRIPILQEKIRTILKDSGAIEKSHIHREMIATFNRMPMRELFYAPPSALQAIIEPIACMLGDEEIIVRTRIGSGYIVLAIAFPPALLLWR